MIWLPSLAFIIMCPQTQRVLSLMHDGELLVCPLYLEYFDGHWVYGLRVGAPRGAKGSTHC